jgi:hypothetical protein
MLTGESSESATTVSVNPARMTFGNRSPARGSGAACAGVPNNANVDAATALIAPIVA